MKRSWRAALISAAMMMGGGAFAHDLTVDLSVDPTGGGGGNNAQAHPGATTATITSYPTSLDFTTTVENANPSVDSTLETATDPTMTPLGWAFTPAPPQDVPPAGQLQYKFTHSFASIQDCASLAAADEDPNTPGPGPDVLFTDTVHISWDSGSAQASVTVTCKQPITEPTERPWPCDDTLFFTANQRLDDLHSPTSLHSMNKATAELSEVSTADLVNFYNAIGYNPVDGYIYGIRYGLPPLDLIPFNHLVRVGSDGVYEDLGELPELGLGVFYPSGTFLQDGTFILRSEVGAVFARVNVATKTVEAEVSVPSFHEFGDFATNPLDGKIYGYDNVTKRLATIDPVTGEVFPFGGLTPTIPTIPPLPPLPPPPTFVVRSAAFDRAGNFYVYGTDLLHPLTEHTLYQVDINSGAFTELASGPVSLNADFAMCAWDRGGIVAKPTRDEGFFKTHEQALKACLDKGAVDLGVFGPVADLPRGLGVLWANPAVSVSHQERTADEKLTLKLAKQQLVATCNARLYGSDDSSAKLLDRGLGALRSANPSLRRGALADLKASNEAGLRLSLPSGAAEGRATPVHAVKAASEPSMQEVTGLGQ